MQNKTAWQEKIVAKAAHVKGLTPAQLADAVGVTQNQLFGKGASEAAPTNDELSAYNSALALIPENVTVTDVTNPVKVDPATGETTTGTPTSPAPTSSATSVQGSVVVAALLSAFALA